MYELGGWCITSFHFLGSIFLKSLTEALSFENRMSILMTNLLKLLYHPLGLVMIKEGEFQNYLMLIEITLIIKQWNA